VEYAPEIRANTICPGVVRTPMLESVMEEGEADEGEGGSDGDGDGVAANLRRMVDDTPLGMGDPAAVADAVAFLATDRSRFVTGATVPVDGGFTAR
jgi:NAD(P)-dependent dehydrogenase (short-subunit alcohol dehydrogenase family)